MLLHHDQGQDFENELFKQLQKECGVNHSQATHMHTEDKLTDSIEPCCLCSEPCQKNINLIEKAMLTISFMLIIINVLNMNPLGNHPFSCSLVGHQDCL